MAAGVWFVYGFNWHDYPIGVFDNELDARRCAMSEYGSVMFWPYGMEYAEAQKQDREAAR